MISPPRRAPTTESRPPRITAGRARNTKNAPSTLATPAAGHGGIDAKTPATAASPAPDAQAIAKARCTLMPWAIAASWSNDVARMAMPCLVLKNIHVPANATRAARRAAT